MKPFVVLRDDGGKTLAAVLKARLGLTWTQARELIAAKRVRVGGQTCSDAVHRLKAGQRVEFALSPKRQRGKSVRPSLALRAQPSIAVVYSDKHVVVADKPSGLTTNRNADEAAEFGARAKRFLPTTLADLLPPLVGGPVRAVHRIDRDTSGLVVFARTADAEAHLGRQFRAHTVTRRYLAVVRGTPVDGRIESLLVRDRGDGRRGSGTGDGQRAVTHVRVVERLGPYSLVECRLETGRTHQVRIHLGEAGCPLAGEHVYDRPVHGTPLADASGAARTLLHAVSLGFDHPATGERVELQSPPPADFEAVVRRLRSLQ